MKQVLSTLVAVICVFVLAVTNGRTDGCGLGCRRVEPKDVYASYLKLLKQIKKKAKNLEQVVYCLMKNIILT